MEIKDASKRLKKFWGKVDQKHICEIEKHVTGKDVLDMGAGYGTTTTYLGNKGFNVIAIDLDSDSIEIAKKLNPSINYKKLNAEQLPFEDNSFDTLILRDALHHFVGEADFDKVKNEMCRVLRNDGKIIFFDPNVNFLIKTLRKISKHEDEECTYEDAIDIMKGLNLKIIHKSFNTIYSLPLSGGYVGINFIPQLNLLQNFILLTEKIFEKLIQNSIGRRIAWRYVIVGEKPSYNKI